MTMLSASLILIDTSAWIDFFRRKGALLDAVDGCHALGDPPALWEEAGYLGFVPARKGGTAKSIDLLIATVALSRGVPVLTREADLAAMRKARAGPLLVGP